MAIQAYNWYNKNSTRKYPIDESATGDADDGTHFPNDILVDCHIRFPSTVGNYAFISSVHVSEHLISITFLSDNFLVTDTNTGTTLSDAESYESSSSSASYTPYPRAMTYPSAIMVDEFSPLAVVNIPRADFIPGQQYLITPQVAGVGGWVVLGPCIDGDNFKCFFSSVNQSKIAPRCARAYDALPVKGVGKKGLTDFLQGLVNLEYGEDIEIIKTQRTIKNVLRDVIVIRLSANTDSRNLLNEYTGTCGARPETENCLYPAIEAIENVLPDCDGNINIVFNNCIQGGEITPQTTAYGADWDPENMFGAWVDPAATSSLSYAPAGEAGHNVDFFVPLVFRDKAIDYCLECGDEFLIQSPERYLEQLALQSSESLANNPQGNATQQPSLLGQWVPRLGSWSGSAGYIPSADEQTLRNVKTYEPYSPVLDDPSVGETVKNRTFYIEGTLNMFDGSPNFGCVFGYQNIGDDHFYYTAEIDKNSDSFRVRYFNGLFETTLAETSPMGLLGDSEYRITAVVNSTGTEVTCTLAIIGSSSIAGYTPATAELTVYPDTIEGAPYTRFGFSSIFARSTESGWGVGY